ETNPIRLYPYGSMASHVIGYLNPIPAGSQSRYLERGYDISKDYIGVSGIEAAYEDRLKGSKGVRTVEVDKNGRTVSELFELETYPGNTVQLTLDLDLQNAAE
ncbi:MAG TPA: cell division protein FtsI, partial [Clostridiaceae bacterium]|nr:cell division protein FtsI [Clostridiaceae bacterium]